jgi:hypothetical protein
MQGCLRQRFRFAPWLTTYKGAEIREGGLVLAKQEYKALLSNTAGRVVVATSLLEPAVKTSRRTYVEFEVAGLGDPEDRFPIQFGVMSMELPPDGWMAEAPGQYMVDAASRNDVVGDCSSGQVQYTEGCITRGRFGVGEGDWVVGDRVGLLVESGRLQVYINNRLIAGPNSHSGDRGIFAEGLLSTVRFAVRFRGYGNDHAVRIIDNATSPGKHTVKQSSQMSTAEGSRTDEMESRKHPTGKSEIAIKEQENGDISTSESQWETDEDWISDEYSDAKSDTAHDRTESINGGAMKSNILATIQQQQQSAIPVVYDKAVAESIDSIMKDLPMVSMPALQIQGQPGFSFKVMVRRSSDEDHLKDLNGRTLHIEPLVTVNLIEDFLRPLVALQWFERPRKDLPWLLALASKCKAGGYTFAHTSNFDCNGLIYFIGSNGGSSPWVNPCRHNLVTIASSDGVTLPVGKLEDILSRRAEPHDCRTENRPNSWFAVDLGVRMLVKRYTLRHAGGRGISQAALRNWELQGSKVND